MGKTRLAPGFRFHPTDVELVRYFLKRKVLGKKLLTNAIAEIDIYKFEPPDLPDKSSLRTGDLKWYFFCPRENKYSNNGKVKRTTGSGYWKATGKDRDVISNDEVVGKKKTLVYHYGKMPRGDRTDWVMHEYRLEDKVLAEKNVPQESYVLCVVFKKNGLGPKNGAQYGAPYNEEEYSDEEEDTENLVAIPSAENADLDPSREISLVAMPLQAPKDCLTGLVSKSCVFDVPPLAGTVLLPSDAVAYTPILEVPEVPPDDVELNSMLDLFVVDNDEYLLFDGFNYQNEVRHEHHVSVPEEAPVFLGDSNFYGNLDLSNELFIELQDMIKPLDPPAQGGSHGDSRSNGQT